MTNSESVSNTVNNENSDLTGYDKIEAEISFRFLNLDKFQAYSLVHEIIGSTHSVNSDTSNNRYVASVPLNNQSFEDINDYYIRQRIELKDCDILVSVKVATNIDSGSPSNISLNSSLSNGVIDIPVIVNRMLKYIDCKLTFSYTAR